MSIIFSANNVFKSFSIGEGETKIFDFNVYKFLNLFDIPQTYRFDIRGEDPVSLSIYNAAGRLVSTTQSTMTVKLSAGRYTLEVHLVDRMKSGKFEIRSTRV